jgi:hypothetical protein
MAEKMAPEKMTPEKNGTLKNITMKLINTEKRHRVCIGNILKLSVPVWVVPM